MDVFTLNATGKPLMGWVWPGAVHYPDFFHPNASQYWQKMLKRLR